MPGPVNLLVQIPTVLGLGAEAWESVLARNLGRIAASMGQGLRKCVKGFRKMEAGGAAPGGLGGR